MKRLLLLGSGILCSFLSIAQNETDALRYSQLTFGGTARFNAMGGAFGALGADISGLSYNPAGIAMYKRTEFTFTPSIYNMSTKSTYNGSAASDSRLNFNFGNIGLVASYTRPESDEPGWVNTNFAFGYNRTNNFHNNISITGANAKSSLLDTYLASAEGLDPDDLDPFGDRLAFDTYLIDSVPNNPGMYYSAVPFAGTQQSKTIETSGSMGETFISFGGNYSNKLYIGATFGFDNVRYSEQSTYEERDHMDTIPGFTHFAFNQDITTRGTGFNFKFGMIFRPSDWMRIGGAVHTPTFFNLHDEYNYSMNSEYDNGNTYEAQSPSGSFDYQITTPMRAIGSIAFIIAKKGLLSADYEYVDYSAASLHSSPNVFFDANNSVAQNYTAAGNIRVGTEWRLDPFSFRAGYALYGSPYKAGLNNDVSRTSYTAGIGIRENGYFIDFAYVLTQYSEQYYLYDKSLTNAATNDLTASSFLITLGFKY